MNKQELIASNEKLMDKITRVGYSYSRVTIRKLMEAITENVVEQSKPKWIENPEELEDVSTGAQYVMQLKGSSLYSFGIYWAINKTVHTRFGTANGTEELSQVIRCFKLPENPKENCKDE